MRDKPPRVVRQWNRPTRSLTVDVQGRVTRLCLCEWGQPVREMELNRQGLAMLLGLLAQANQAVVATENLLALIAEDEP